MLKKHLICIVVLLFLGLTTFSFAANAAMSKSTATDLLNKAFETASITEIKQYAHLTDEVLDYSAWHIGCSSSCMINKEDNPDIFKGQNGFSYAFDKICLRAEIAKHFGRVAPLKNLPHFESFKLKFSNKYMYASMCGDAGADDTEVHFSSMRTEGNRTILQGNVIDSEGKKYGTLTISVVPDNTSPFGYIFESLNLKTTFATDYKGF